MAKGCYIGVNGKAHKVKKGYVGVSGKARKIKKAYIGVGGKARICWSGGELAYYGTTTPLSVARRSLSATSIGNYALFAGGYTRGPQSEVDSYTSSLVMTTLGSGLRLSCSDMGATSNSNYAIFGGGNFNGPQSTVTTFSKTLVRTIDLTLATSARGLAATSIGNYALFGGGDNSNNLGSGTTKYDNVDVYTVA